MTLVEKVAKFLVIITRPVMPDQVDSYWKKLSHPEQRSFLSDANDIHQLYLADPSIIEVGICKCGHTAKYHSKDADGDDICWYAQDCDCHNYNPANNYIEVDTEADLPQYRGTHEGVHTWGTPCNRCGYEDCLKDMAKWVKPKEK